MPAAKVTVRGHGDIPGAQGTAPAVTDRSMPGVAVVAAVPNPVPVAEGFGTTVISWDTGDGSDGRVHVSVGGIYDHDALRTSETAVRALDAARDDGTNFLLFPNTSFWWLRASTDFKDHLDTHFDCVWADEACIIYDLRKAGGTKPRGAEERFASSPTSTV